MDKSGDLFRSQHQIFTDGVEANVEQAEIHVQEGMKQLSKARVYEVLLIKCSSGPFHYCIEDIYFFEVNIKYISSSELKTSKFSRVRSTSENLDVFKSRDEIYYIWYLPIRSKFSFYFIQYTGIFLFTKQAVKMQKPKTFENTNNFGTTLFLTF